MDRQRHPGGAQRSGVRCGLHVRAWAPRFQVMFIGCLVCLLRNEKKQKARPRGVNLKVARERNLQCNIVVRTVMMMMMFITIFAGD